MLREIQRLAQGLQLVRGGAETGSQELVCLYTAPEGFPAGRSLFCSFLTLKPSTVGT